MREKFSGVELSGHELVAEDQIIRIMPVSLANKIAAGEVVQRPASAVKELIENALDAGASEIVLYLKGAGSELIQVVDNGCGMSAVDATICLDRHATSKIREIKDLDSIRTFGFRGEALSSIAAVSNVVVRTKRIGDDIGIEVRVDGGITGAANPVATNNGTSISVRNLFFNVPARRNFLKKPATELKHILDSVHVLALANAEVSFRVITDGNELLDLRPGDIKSPAEALRKRMGDLLSIRSTDEMIDVLETTSYLSVSGFIGRPEGARRSRGQQFLFVNGRYVRHRYLEHAIFSAYEYVIPDGTYPLFAIFLSIDPRHVDVNVHPTKSEVKFDDERGVYGVLRTIIRRALGTAENLPDASNAIPLEGLTLDFETLRRETAPKTGASDMYGGSTSPFTSRPDARQQYQESSLLPGQVSERLYDSTLSGLPARTPDADADAVHEGTPETGSNLLWQLHDAYVLTQIRTGLVIVDQQAAHERVLYEKALESLSDGFGLSQQLLFPRTLEFDAADFVLLNELIPDLRSLGFDLEKFGGRSIMLRGVPADMVAGDERSVLDEVLEQYKHFEDVERLTGHENLARSIARKSAVKPGKRLSHREMRALIDQLFHCKTPYLSPSGRPTIVKLSVDELRERFSRKL